MFMRGKVSLIGQTMCTENVFPESETSPHFLHALYDKACQASHFSLCSASHHEWDGGIQYHFINVSLVFPPQHSDMNEEMRVEAMELCVTACEKHSNNNEASVALIYDCVQGTKIMLFVSLYFPPALPQHLIGGSQDDKRYNGQEVWSCMACCSGGRIRL